MTLDKNPISSPTERLFGNCLVSSSSRWMRHLTGGIQHVFRRLDAESNKEILNPTSYEKLTFSHARRKCVDLKEFHPSGQTETFMTGVIQGLW